MALARTCHLGYYLNQFSSLFFVLSGTHFVDWMRLYGKLLNELKLNKKSNLKEQKANIHNLGRVFINYALIK